jgi:hypothetical protein
MKSIFKFFAFSLMALTLVLGAYESVSARDLTYRIGAGWRQESATWVYKDGVANGRAALNGLEASYGIARDIQLGAFFGFARNFHFAMVGPKIRYDVQRLFNRDASVWQYLNIFTEAAFYTKFGSSAKTGIVIHAPYVGFEILPFSNNNLAIQMAGGLILDFVGKNSVSFTQNTLGGDFGLKYYF